MLYGLAVMLLELLLVVPLLQDRLKGETPLNAIPTVGAFPLLQYAPPPLIV